MNTKSIYNLTALAALIALITGCETTAPNQAKRQRMPFPEAEYAALPKTGTSTIRGQAFLTTRGGEVKTAAGQKVILNPVTSYSSEWYNYSRQGIPLVNGDDKQDEYCRKTEADGDGRFTFKNIPAGEYYITSLVSWEVPDGSGMSKQGGLVTRRVKVSDSEELNIIISTLLVGQ